VLAKYNLIIQAGLTKIPQYEEVPLLRDLAKTPEEQQIFDFISRAVVIARPIVTNPGVPADRVAALRRAFDATLADPAFLEDADRQGLEIAPKSGEELAKIVTDLIETPPDILEKVSRAIQFKGAEPVRAKTPRQ
jgi:hypothetical protein